MINEFSYYKVAYQEFTYGPNYSYWEHKEKVFYNIYEAREFKKFMKKHTGGMAEIRKITQKTEIIE